MTTPSEQIAANALGPKKVSVDGQSVEQHSIQDQIAAQEYLANQKAAKRAHRGLMFTKLVPPGSV